MNTIELTIELTHVEPWSEILVAELSELGFESFVNRDNGIIAYAPESINYDAVIVKSSLTEEALFKFSLSKKIIPYQNWNATWEENFEPVYVEEYASILAPFHDAKVGKGMLVTIQPQMSFGTGHHQTTWMMTKALFELDKMPNNVLDMGTGTGVLAIVAENLGAERVLAIDIEDWSAINASENATRNNTKNIECKCGDIDLLGTEKFGLVIANINKNILKSHMQSYSNALNYGGALLLSGFFISDVEEMVEFAGNYSFEKTKLFQKDEWAAIQLVKK